MSLDEPEFFEVMREAFKYEKPFSPAEVDAFARIMWLERGLELIIEESRSFPDEDGIGAGKMARNILEAQGAAREW